MFLSDVEKEQYVKIIISKMEAANKARGDVSSAASLTSEASMVLGKILQTSSSTGEMNEKITRVVRNLESISPAEQVAWLSSNTSMLYKRLDSTFAADMQIKALAESLLKEKNHANLLKRAGDIGTIQGFLKANKGREAPVLNEALMILESIKSLQENPPALTQALGVLVYEKLRILPIDKHAKDTICASLPRDTSPAELSKVNLVVKLIAIALSSLGPTLEFSKGHENGSYALEANSSALFQGLRSCLSAPTSPSGVLMPIQVTGK